VSATWEREDVASIMAGVFDINVKLETISHEVVAIRRLIEDDEEEEETPEDD